MLTAAGQVLSGVAKSETLTTIQLFQADGRQIEVLKDDVEERVLSQVSIMPANFGLLLAREELADVVAWLITLQAPDVLASAAGVASADDSGESDNEATIEFSTNPWQVVITANGHPLATYYYADPKITRPFLAHVHAPGGIQVTRNHPPQAGEPSDHAEYHPGIFLAFGDISGHDYWRLNAKVVHDGFQQLPKSAGNRGSFVVRNRYLSTDGQKTICIETCKLTFHALSDAYRIDWESQFSSADGDFYFGDQEEMGLGVRVASAIRENGGNGRLLNSEGLETAARTWGQAAAWCDYAGTIGGEHVGVAIMAAPYNARPSWWHSRDYGVFVANLFGRQAMRQGPQSRLEMQRGDTFRLGYGILLHASRETRPNLGEQYRRYVEAVSDDAPSLP